MEKSIKILILIFSILFIKDSSYAELLQVVNDGLLYTINTVNGTASCDGPLEKNGKYEDRTFIIMDQFCYKSSWFEVTGISPEAFKGINCYKIYFPKGLKDIGIGAFEECSGIRGELEFNETGIRASAFKSCSGITALKLSGKSFIEGNAFENCENLSSLILEEGVSSIGSKAFENCNKISEVSLKNGIERIDDRAFAKTNIHSITIPSTVEYLGNELFENTGLEEVMYCAIECKEPYNLDLSVFPESIRILTISKDVKFIPHLFNHCSHLRKINYDAYSAVIKDASSPFPPSVEEVTIGDSVNRIPAYFLKNNQSLKEIKINNSVRGIGFNAFENCSSLENVEIARYSVSTIESEAFRNCKSLKSIKLPYSLTNLENGAFMNCTSLENIDFGIGSFSTIEHHTFENCINLKSLDFSKTQIECFDTAAFRGCQNLTSIVWGRREYSRGYIGDYAFENCISLKQAGVADKSTTYEGIESYIGGSSIGKYSFSGCKSLNNISIGADRIYEGAFKNCENLKNLHISSASFDGDYIFDECPIEKIAYGDFEGKYRPFETKSSIKYIRTGTDAMRKGEFPKLHFEKIVFSSLTGHYLNGYEMPYGSGIRESFAADTLIQEGLVYYIDDQGYPCEDINPFGIGQFKNIVVSPELKLSDSNIPENAYIGSSSEYANIENIKIIRKRAFYNSGLKHLSINQVDSICEEAFSNNAIGHIFLSFYDQPPTFDDSAFDQHSYDNTIVYYINSDNNKDIDKQSDWRKFKRIYKIPQLNTETMPLETKLGNKVNLDSIMAQDINLKGIPDLRYEYYDSRTHDLLNITDNIFECSLAGEYLINAKCFLPCKAYDREERTSSFANVYEVFFVISVKDLSPTKLIDYIGISPTKKTLNKDECIQLEARILPKDADMQTLVWDSSNESVAKVDDTGLVTATGIGECVITAAAVDGSNVSATCSITVEPILVESLTISPKVFSVSITDPESCFGSELFKIDATVLPENADNKKLEYSSNDEDVAVVNEAGRVDFINTGSATISVKTTDGSNLSAECFVEIRPYSGINDIFTDNSIRCDVYNTTGMLLRKDADREYVERLSKGIYIIVMGNKVTKLSLREN